MPSRERPGLRLTTRRLLSSTTSITSFQCRERYRESAAPSIHPCACSVFAPEAGTTGGSEVCDRCPSPAPLAVTLLQPGVAVHVVAIHLPEAGAVGGDQLHASHPLGRLPEVEIGDHPARRAAVLDIEWLPLVV